MSNAPSTVRLDQFSRANLQWPGGEREHWARRPAVVTRIAHHAVPRVWNAG